MGVVGGAGRGLPQSPTRLAHPDIVEQARSLSPSDPSPMETFSQHEHEEHGRTGTSVANAFFVAWGAGTARHGPAEGRGRAGADRYGRRTALIFWGRVRDSDATTFPFSFWPFQSA